jgi:hypothetical protein
MDYRNQKVVIIDVGGKHDESIFTRFFHSFYLSVKFGYDLRNTYLSALVFFGQMTRDEALVEISKPPVPQEMLDQDREYVIKKLGLNEDEFELILKSPNKNYSDYPNNECLWKRFNGIIRVARNYITRVG